MEKGKKQTRESETFLIPGQRSEESYPVRIDIIA
jgi:hypothetical protein